MNTLHADVARIASALDDQGRRTSWLAEKLGMQRPNLANALKGNRRLSPERIQRAAELLGIDLNVQA